jgi:hypothetical protein
LRLLESLTEPLIPTALNAACGQATSKDQGFEVSKVSPPVPCVSFFGSGLAEPKPRSHITRMLVAYSDHHWRWTAVRQVPACFRERTSGFFHILLFDFSWGVYGTKRDNLRATPLCCHKRAYGNMYKKDWVTDRDLIRFGSLSQRSCITFVNSAIQTRRGLTERKRWVRHLLRCAFSPCATRRELTAPNVMSTAAVFAPVVFRDLPGESISPVSKRDFILLFIT